MTQVIEEHMRYMEEKAEACANRPRAADHFVVVAGDCAWFVSTEMARFIEACLEAEAAPRWVTFVDLTGARVRLRARLIDAIHQSTADQRAARRAFHRALERERKADRSYH
jgi:CTP:molybdopterin cytidylyltransferase MocA